MDKLFVIAIGGTGMRCLESFTHLCAIGMFDNQEIEILTLDTDATNGNKSRVEGLIENYIRIKTFGVTENDKGGSANANTFFSAKLNLHRYWTNYSGDKRNNFKALSQIDLGTENVKGNNKLIADLFLDTNTVQEFDLSHGYRAQTHLGSMLMYHGIVESARNCYHGKGVQPELELEKFCDKLVTAGANARVFIFGSVFGGTGASSIPVLPKALKKFAEVRSNNERTINVENVKFGSTLLTEYFTFKKPDSTEKKDKKNSVIADSSFFPINSQAALQFYQADPTVKKCYKILYHIGWPLISKKTDDEAAGKTITGGEAQKNGCHITELLSACAAYDFFTRTSAMESSSLDAKIVYKSAEYVDGSFNFYFDDFMVTDNNANAGKIFANKIGAFFSLAHICLSKNEGAFDGTGKLGIKGFLKQLEISKIPQYISISDEECKDLNDYFKLFAYACPNGRFEDGWLYQINKSVMPGKFLFDSKSFPNLQSELLKLDVGTLFLDANYHWEKTIWDDRYSKFIKLLLEVGVDDSQKASSTKEKFLAHIYNGITKSQPNLINS